MYLYMFFMWKKPTESCCTLIFPSLTISNPLVMQVYIWNWLVIKDTALQMFLIVRKFLIEIIAQIQISTSKSIGSSRIFQGRRSYFLWKIFKKNNQGGVILQRILRGAYSFSEKLRAFDKQVLFRIVLEKIKSHLHFSRCHVFNICARK